MIHVYVSCLNFWVFKKKNVNYKNYCCCYFVVTLFSFVIAVVKLTKLMAKEQRLSSIVDMVKKNPKDCVLAVHGGRPKLQYIKCHPNFLVFFAQL